MTPVVMLDVDGVLIRSKVPWTHNLKADLGIDPADLQRVFFKKHWHRIVTGAADVEPVLATALGAMRSDVSAGTLLDYWFSHDAAIDDSVLADVGTIRAAGQEIWLATNQDNRRAAHLMDGLGLAAKVNGIVHSARVGARKPHAAYFKAAAAITGHPAGAHLLIDDTQTNIKGAKSAGWKAHHWTGAQTLATIVARHKS